MLEVWLARTTAIVVRGPGPGMTTSARVGMWPGSVFPWDFISPFAARWDVLACWVTESDRVEL